MTPEFRIRIFTTYPQFDQYSLVTQLFRLFAELQHGKHWAVETIALTKRLNIDGCAPGDTHDVFTKILKMLELEMIGLPENEKIHSFYEYDYDFI